MSRGTSARRIGAAGLIVGVLCGGAGPVAGEELALDLPAALARAARLAPVAVAARGRVGEAAAVRVGAGVRFSDNPTVALEAGPRFGGGAGGERTTDVSVQLEQQVLPAGRGARRGLADAGVAAAEAEVAAVERDVAREVALAYYAGLYAERLVALGQAAEELASRAAETATRRRAAGAVTDLEVDLTRAALGRARAAVRAAGGERTAALGRLAVLVGAGPDDVLVLRGDLRVAEVPADEVRGEGGGGVEARADLRAVAAERGVARAQERVARRGGRPEVGVWVGYAREEDAQIVVGGLRLSLPVWQRGQGARAEARARAARVEAQYQAQVRAAGREARDAEVAYRQAGEAVTLFEAEVLPSLDDAEALLTRGLEAGTVPVGEYLVARGELLDGRREYLARLLALAEARVNARLAAGVSP